MPSSGAVGVGSRLLTGEGCYDGRLWAIAGRDSGGDVIVIDVFCGGSMATRQLIRGSCLFATDKTQGTVSYVPRR